VQRYPSWTLPLPLPQSQEAHASALKGLQDELSGLKGKSGEAEAAMRALRDEHNKIKGQHGEAEEALKRAQAEIAAKDAELAGLKVCTI